MSTRQRDVWLRLIPYSTDVEAKLNYNVQAEEKAFVKKTIQQVSQNALIKRLLLK